MASNSCARELNNFRYAENFVKNILAVNDGDNSLGYKYDDLIEKIASTEMQLNEIIESTTLTSKDNRYQEYSSDENRRKLRQRIFQELIQEERTDNEDDTCLGVGGLLPKTGLKTERLAFYIIGLPASGKSGIANVLSDKFGAMILDSDIAKRKIPEYKGHFGASLVHDESSLIVFGDKKRYPDEQNVLRYAAKAGHNLIIPKIGDDKDKIVDFACGLIRLNYTVHLVLVRLDREKAVVRACKRFLETNRYVPLSLIFDVYGNNPTISYYDLKRNNQHFKSYTMISTDVRFGEPTIILDRSRFSPITKDII